MGSSQNLGTGNSNNPSSPGVQTPQNSSMPQSSQPSKLKKIGKSIVAGSKTVADGLKKAGGKIKNNWHGFSDFFKADEEDAYGEENRLADKGLFVRFLACIIPGNLFGFIILYFLLQDFVIDAFLYNFNYNSPALIAHHTWACFLIGLILFIKLSIRGNRDPEQGIMAYMFNLAFYLTLVFSVGLFVEFMILPILKNIIGGMFLKRVGLTVFTSGNLELIFARSLKPYWTFISLLLFGRFTRFRKFAIFVVIVAFLVTNIGVIDDGIRSTVSLATSTKYYTTGKDEAAMVINQIKLSLSRLNPVTWFQNYLNDLKNDFSGEHVDGEYTVSADVSGVIFENAYSSNSLAVYEGNEEPQSDANVIINYVKSPDNDCVINGICDSNNDFKIKCCVDNSKFQVSNEIESGYSSCSDEQSYPLTDLAYLDTVHTCYIKKNPDSVVALDAEEKVNVNITGEYTFQTVANKDFRFAEKSFIQRCKTQSYASGYSNIMECMKFPATDSSSSQASSGPILIGIGTPEEFNAEVLSIDFNKDTQDTLPLLISLTNKGDGKIKSLNSLYLAMPKEITVEKFNLCKFEEAAMAECVSAFGAGITSNPLSPTDNPEKYKCYKYDFSGLSEGTKESVLENVQTGSIHCNLKPTKEILDGDKVTKSIKVYANYTYEISTSVDITFKNTALSKQKESASLSGSNDEQTKLSEIKNTCTCGPTGELSDSNCETGYSPTCFVDSYDQVGNYIYGCTCEAKDIQTNADITPEPTTTLSPNPEPTSTEPDPDSVDTTDVATTQPTTQEGCECDLDGKVISSTCASGTSAVCIGGYNQIGDYQVYGCNCVDSSAP